MGLEEGWQRYCSRAWDRAKAHWPLQTYPRPLHERHRTLPARRLTSEAQAIEAARQVAAQIAELAADPRNNGQLPTAKPSCYPAAA